MSFFLDWWIAVSVFYNFSRHAPSIETTATKSPSDPEGTLPLDAQITATAVSWAG